MVPGSVRRVYRLQRTRGYSRNVYKRVQGKIVVVRRQQETLTKYQKPYAKYPNGTLLEGD